MYIIFETCVVLRINHSTQPDTFVQLNAGIFFDLNDNANNAESILSQDKVGPVISGARILGSTLYLTASENIDGATINNNSFIFSGAAVIVNSATVSGKEITLDLSSPISAGVQISFKPSTVGDMIGNKQQLTKYATISSSVIINEVMYSTSNNQYIELRNLGNTSVSLSGWTIANAGITIPSGVTISASGYYLIANSSITSLSGVTANYLTALNLNNTSQSDLLLKDTSLIVYDKAKASPWASGNSGSGYSMERLSNPGDGLDINNWYTSVVSDGIISPYRGTPGKINIFDSISPSIDSFSPANNTLVPLGSLKLDFAYSDNVGVNMNSVNLSLDKCISGSCNPIITGMYNNTFLSSTGAYYNVSGLDYGKYRATLNISDNAGNSRIQVVYFYIDNPSIVVSTPNTSIATLDSGGIMKFSEDVVVTVRTVGAGVNLSLGGSGTLSGPGGGIGLYDGSYGYGFDYSETGSGNIKTFDDNLTAINNTIIGNYTLDTNTLDGEMRTYVYTVRYGAKAKITQAAGLYSSVSKFDIGLSY